MTARVRPLCPVSSNSLCDSSQLYIDQEYVLDDDVYMYIRDNDTMQITRLETTESTTRGSYDGWHYIE